MPKPMTATLCLAALAVAATAGCSSEKGGAETALTATDNACTLAATELKQGDHTLAISNTGSKTTEVYVYGKQDGKFTKIIEEKEHIGPGTKAKLNVHLDAGTYEVACKPGEKGDGIRTTITVK